MKDARTHTQMEDMLASLGDLLERLEKVAIRLESSAGSDAKPPQPSPEDVQFWDHQHQMAISLENIAKAGETQQRAVALEAYKEQEKAMDDYIHRWKAGQGVPNEE